LNILVPYRDLVLYKLVNTFLKVSSSLRLRSSSVLSRDGKDVRFRLIWGKMIIF